MGMKLAKKAKKSDLRVIEPLGRFPVPSNENRLDIGKPKARSRFLLRLGRAIDLVPERQGRQILAHVRAERDHGRLLLFSPVALGTGAALWFQAGAEPAFWYMAVLFAAASLAYFVLRYRRPLAGIVAAAIALALSGGLLATVETARTNTIILDKPVTTILTGIVTAREASGIGRWRYAVAVEGTRQPALKRLPGTVALIVRGASVPAEIGDRIEGLARIEPPSGPALPGLTDFAFSAYFNGIGGMGYFYGKPVIAHRPQTGLDSVYTELQGMRLKIGDRIRGVIGGDEGAFGAALVTNEQRAISKPVMDALRLSGLAHIIAISGMNMALAAGLSFVGLRVLFSLSVGLTHRLPVKKLAAMGALLAVSAYYTISGFAVSAERAYIMMAIMLAAVLFDRPALSMRNMALSALVILIISPDALMGASFQMSYAGTLGLISAYEFWSGRRRSDETTGGLPIPVAMRMVGVFVVDAVVTSAIGGTATALFSLVHFQRLGAYSLIANVLVTPLLSFVVMPMAMISMLAMPLRLDWLPLKIMGLGIKGVIGIGNMVAGWGGEWLPGPIPGWYFVTATLALLLLTLLRTRLRLTGAALFAGATLLLMAQPSSPKPDLLVAEDGRLAAFVGDDLLAADRDHPEPFIFDQWQRTLRIRRMEPPEVLTEPPDIRHDAREDRYRPLTDEEEIAERVFMDQALSHLKGGRFICKKASWCALRIRQAGLVMLVDNSIYAGLACDMATVVVANPSPRFTACRSHALLITRETLRRTGALTLRWPDDHKPPEITAALQGLSRPWQSFRAYDWRTVQSDPTIPPSLLSLLGDREEQLLNRQTPEASAAGGTSQ